MRIFKRYAIACFLAAVLGAVIGSIRDDIVQNSVVEHASHHEPTPAPLQAPTEKDFERSNNAFEAQEIACLGEIIFREARSESVGIQRLMAMTVIARRDDPDPQWPKTICGILRQPGAISHADRQLDIGPRGVAVLSRALSLAEEVYESAWKTQLLPHGWECVRYWRLSDERLASLKAAHRKQLGISEERRGLNFFDKLEPVPTPPGTITFFRDPNRCGKRLPTT
jgi:hypothetical protein